MRPRRFGVGLDLRHEFRAFELERRQFGVDGLVEFFGGFCPHRRQFGCRCAIAPVGLGRGCLQLFQLVGAGIDQRHIGGVFGGKRRQAIDRGRIFARGGAERKQPLLDPLQLGRVEIGRDQRGTEMLVGLFQRVDGDIDRSHRRFDQRRRIGGTAFQPAYRGRQRRHRRMVTADRLLRLAQIAGDLLALHHRGAAFGERGFLAVLGRQRLQFVGGVAEIVGFAGGAVHAGAMFVERADSAAPRFPNLFERRNILLETGEGVEQPAMGRGIDQRALVVLAVDLDQRRAHRFQGLHADRLVVDEGPGAAVRKLHPAQDHFTGVVEAVIGQDCRRRMALGHIEHGGNLALLHTVTDEARVAAAAERQREGIEQDGFARAGFTGQHREATGKLDIEPFDQDDVTDRQTRQHAR